MEEGRIDWEQRRQYAVDQCVAVGSAIIVSAIAGGVIVLAIGAVRGGLAGWLEHWPWVLPAGGIAALAVLAMVVFWLVRSRTTVAQGPEDAMGRDS
jgi:membrane protein implicated in regulation of membrane protease activity